MRRDEELGGNPMSGVLAINSLLYYPEDQSRRFAKDDLSTTINLSGFNLGLLTYEFVLTYQFSIKLLFS